MLNKNALLASFALLLAIFANAQTAYGQQEVRVHELPGLDIQRGWKSKTEKRVRNLFTGGALRTGSKTAQAAVTGKLRLPVVVVDFLDGRLVYPPSRLGDRMFGNPTDLISVAQYYAEMSNDLFTVTGDVSSIPIQLPYNSAWYVGNRGIGGVADRLDVFLNDILYRAAALFDWRLFDNDGADGVPNSGDDDGYVDVLVIVYSTPDGSCSATNNGKMWAHRWNLTSVLGHPFDTGAKTPDGKPIYIDDYIAIPAYDCDGQQLAPMGILIHEIGHVLGLPDLYPTNPQVPSEGVGYWDLMGSGNWNTPEYPAALGAWSRLMLGWVNAIEVTDAVNLTIPPVHVAREVVLVPSPVAADYLLLEYRTRIDNGPDMHLKQEGLVIWQVDPERVEQFWKTNEINNDPGAPGIAVIQADGRNDLELGLCCGGNRGDAGDVWPNVWTGARSLTHETTPAAVTLASKTPLQVRLDNIRIENNAVVLDVTPGLEPYAIVELSSNIGGVRATLNGAIAIALPYTGQWPVGSTLAVEIDTAAAAGTRVRINSWSDGWTGPSRTITINTRETIHLSVHAYREHQLVVAPANPDLGSAWAEIEGGGELAADTWVPEGMKIVLNVQPAADTLYFVYWDGQAAGMTPKELAKIQPGSVISIQGPSEFRAVLAPRIRGGYTIADALLGDPNVVPESIRRYLDVLGNQNGRLDVGDYIIGLQEGVLKRDGNTLKLEIPLPNSNQP